MWRMELEREDVGPPEGELLLLGVEELDRQHRDLLQRWQVLEDARLRGDPRAVRANLWFLERYAAEHIAAEERLMEEVRFPALLRHRREHERFGERLRRLRLAVEAGRRAADPAHFAWIARWFRDHVRDEDGVLGRFLNERTALRGR